MVIIIRKARPKDAKGLLDSFNEGIRRKFNIYTGRNTIQDNASLVKARKSFAKKTKHEFTLIAFDSSSHTIVGSIMFWAKEKGRLRHRGELGWGVHPDYTRRGIATLLLNAMIVELRKKKYIKVQAEIAIENKPSIALAQKCGFMREGKLTKGMLLDDGRYIDTLIFGKVLR
jgi:RimJ/RimL family protein N-acetyltransferase